MQITVHLPDDVARHPDAGREALEALVIEGYRTEALSPCEAAQMLEMSRFEFEALLKAKQVDDHAYGVEEFNEDMDTFRRLRNNGVL